MVNKKDSKKKQGGGKKSPPPPIGPVNPVSSSAPSRKVRQDQENQPQHNVSEAAIVKLTAALVRWTGVLAVATIGLGIIAYFQWQELHNTDETLRKTLEVCQRAWIAPIRPVLRKPFAYQSPFEVALVYKNTGQQPAQNTRSEFDLKVDPGNPMFPPSNLGPRGGGIS